MSDLSTQVRSPFAPLLLVTCSVLVWMAYQTKQLATERDALAASAIAQMQPLEQSRKLRASLDSIAAHTQRLADSGNASAKLLVDELKKRGITINLNAQTAQPPR